ncbi:hypothetical protein ACFZBE_17840 [Streptomyces sp. NPDC008061]|uniref:hypothetical protein n=1 Tax=Streptomyces sp. NPDC008061 TaxID=3364805 RepID=UPI0036E5AC3A
MTAKTTAEQRVANLRAEREAAGENVSHLSDLDILNDYAEQQAAEQIGTRDRYMGLLVEQRKHGERVRAATLGELQSRIDGIAVNAVRRRASELERILAAVEHLPARPNVERVELLQKIAADTRHMLRLRNEDNDAPTRQWRLDDYQGLVHNARSVIGVLGSRDGISADEVIRLVGEALKSDGNLRDLFKVADTGTLKPEFARRRPLFVGANWADRNSYYAYEPAGTGARVVAYNVGDAWHLDLYSPTGALLAYGTTTEQQVENVAAVLVDNAPAMVGDGLHAWQRYQQVTTRAIQPVAA